jgi:hypothetical protein
VGIAITPKDGTQAGKYYLVNYHEDQWYRYDEAGQEFCWAHWIKCATPLGCVKVCLRLIPDELFPTHGHDKPYVIERAIEQRGRGDDCSVRIEAHIEINQEKYRDNITAGRAAAKAIGDKLPVDSYRVYLGRVILDQGKGVGHGYRGSTK